MEIKEQHYDLRSGNRLCLDNVMISNDKKSNLMVTEHRYNVRSRSCKRSHSPGEVINRENKAITPCRVLVTNCLTNKEERTNLWNKSGSVYETYKQVDTGLIKKNSKIHKENIEVRKRSEERGSITNNQNTKQMFVDDQSENKENISDYKIKQEHKAIKPCRVLLTDCLSKEGKRKNLWNKSESVYETYKQAGKPFVYSETEHIYSQASQCPKAVPDVLAMSNISNQFIHKDNSETDIISRVNYQRQISRRTLVVSEEIASQFCTDISEESSRSLDSTRSPLVENMHRRQFLYSKSAYIHSNSSNLRQSVAKSLDKNMSLWIFVSILLLLIVFGSWDLIMRSSSSVHGMSENITDEFPSVLKVRDNKSREAEEKWTYNSTLVNKILMLEKELTYLKKYLVNISHILEDYKIRQTDFQKEYNEKNNMSDKLNISELNDAMNNEINAIKDELKNLRNISVELTHFINNYTETRVNEILSDYFPQKILEGDLAENVSCSGNGSCSDIDQTIWDDNASDSNSYISEEQIRKIMKEMLQIYDADKTGQVDYALESAGGEIISTRNTQHYDIKLRVFIIFGVPLYYQSHNNDPSTVIQRNVLQPGVCWAFQDFPGCLLIRLRSIIYVTGFTLEHASKLIVPGGDVSSAPRNFTVWGLTDKDDPEPVIFGNYEFVYSEDNLQYFPVQNTQIKKPYEYIELRIYSNHGQVNYTCLYKFRVHGRPAEGIMTR